MKYLYSVYEYHIIYKYGMYGPVFELSFVLPVKSAITLPHQCVSVSLYEYACIHICVMCV